MCLSGAKHLKVGSPMIDVEPRSDRALDTLVPAACIKRIANQEKMKIDKRSLLLARTSMRTMIKDATNWAIASAKAAGLSGKSVGVAVRR